MKSLDAYKAAAVAYCEDCGYSPDGWESVAATMKANDLMAECLAAHPPKGPEPEGQPFQVALAGMKEGEKWRRKSWHEGVYRLMGGGDLFSDRRSVSAISYAELVATDWEKVDDA